MSEAKRFQDWKELGDVREGGVFVCVEAAGFAYTVGKEYAVVNNPAYTTLSLIDNCKLPDAVSSCEVTVSTFIKKQKEEKKMAFDGKQLFGKKYRVTPETSKLIQETVFAAGGLWREGERFVAYLNKPFLYVSEQLGSISYGEEDWLFDEHVFSEGIITLGVVGVTVVPAVDKEKEEKKKQLEELDAKIKELQAIANKLKEETL